MPKKDLTLWLPVKRKDLPKIVDQLTMITIVLKNKYPAKEFREIREFEKQLWELSQKNQE